MNHIRKVSVSAVFLAFLLFMTVLMLALPKTEYSENEKRTLAKAPQVGAENIASGQFGKDFETYLSDHFPLRDLFVGINAYTQLYTGRNGASGIYACEDGYLIPTPATLNHQRAVSNMTLLSNFAKNSGLPATVIAIPNPGYILSDKLPANHLSYMDDEAFRIIKENAGDMTVIDLRDTLRNSNDQIYYRTDHHLTSAGSNEVYRAYCAALGVVPQTFTCVQTNGNFYGTGYSRSGLWLKKPDMLEIWKTENPSAFTVTIKDYAKTETYNSLYFSEHLENLDQYPVFLDGNHEMVIIENQNVKNGKRLLLFKDSYAHCFATMAAEDYEMICMVDLRYYKNFTTSQLIGEYGITEILYLYGIETMMGDTNFGRLM